MITPCTRLLTAAVLIVCGLPILARAESCTFKNDCKVSLVLQIATVQRGVLKRDQGVLKPGETSPKMPLNTDKVISVYDAKTGRLLFRDALRISKTPLNFSMAPDPRIPARLRMVLLKPPPPPAPPPDMPPGMR